MVRTSRLSFLVRRRPDPDPPALLALLDGTRRWPIAGVLAFRLASAAGPVSIVVQYYGVRQVAPVVLVAVVLGLANATLLLVVLRQHRLGVPRLGPWVAADTVVAVAVNLWSGPALPGSVNFPYHDVFWFYAMSTVMLIAGCCGVAAAAAAVLLSVPLQLVMTALDEPVPPGQLTSAVIGRTGWLAVGLFGAWLVLRIMRNSAAVALGEGVRAGRQAEQLHMLRSMHDTVLQTLEGIALLARDEVGLDDEEPARLRRVGEAASVQAEQLRRSLLAVPGSPPGVDSEDPYRPAGGPSGPSLLAATLPAGRTGRPAVEALQLAVCEALANVAKHAAADQVMVWFTSSPDRLEVVVRDDGRGFDSRDAAGFGLAQSIVGRLHDAGGDAEVWSVPRQGAEVRMWVPHGT